MMTNIYLSVKHPLGTYSRKKSKASIHIFAVKIFLTHIGAHFILHDAKLKVLIKANKNKFDRKVKKSKYSILSQYSLKKIAARNRRFFYVSD